MRPRYAERSDDLRASRDAAIGVGRRRPSAGRRATPRSSSGSATHPARRADALRSLHGERPLRPPGRLLRDATTGARRATATTSRRRSSIPIFGATLAAQVEEVWSRLGQPETFTLREEAAGSGALGVAILDRLVAAGSPLASVMRYLPVEVDAAREAGVRARVIAAGHEARLAETRSPGPAGDRASIIANELLDALPVQRLTRRDGELLELHVDWRDDWFAEVALPPSTRRWRGARPRGDRAGRRPGGRGRPRRGCLGARSRCPPRVRVWRWSSTTGTRPRTSTTLRSGWPACCGPTAVTMSGDDPYRSVGRQDLTAHVDWTALELAATDGGLTVTRPDQPGRGADRAGPRRPTRRARARGRRPRRPPTRQRVPPWSGWSIPEPWVASASLLLGRGMALEPPLRSLAFRLPPRPR